MKSEIALEKDPKEKENLQKKLNKIYVNRQNTIHDIFHKLTTAIINYLRDKRIGTLVIGYNKGWKQRMEMGKKNNREFQEIPYRKMVNMLFYKGKKEGIKVEEQNESYTSKCDALSFEQVGYHYNYMGKRVKRGLLVL